MSKPVMKEVPSNKTEEAELIIEEVKSERNDSFKEAEFENPEGIAELPMWFKTPNPSFESSSMKEEIDEEEAEGDDDSIEIEVIDCDY